MAPEEMLIEGSLYDYWLTEFRKCRILEIYGLNFNQFLDQPRAEIQAMCARAKAEDLKELNATADLRRQLEALLPGLTKK